MHSYYHAFHGSFKDLWDPFYPDLKINNIFDFSPPRAPRSTVEQLREEMDEMREQMGHLMLEMQDLIHNQDALKEENSQLKTQLSLVMEILKTVLRKEGDVVPTAATEVVDPFSSVGSLPTHGMPQRALPQFQVPLPPRQNVHAPGMNQGDQMCGKKPKKPRRILNPIP